MDISEFDYDLPAELIAQKPSERRDGSRMMVLDRKTGEIHHSQFKEFVQFFCRGDVLVLNDTKVFPARVWGKKNGAIIEFLFIEQMEKSVWRSICRPARKVKIGDVISFSPLLQGTVVGTEEEGKRILRLSAGNVISELNRIGYAPLPPYIKRKPLEKESRDSDRRRYQTVFARKEGAIAAPTAGLHFTPRILDTLKDKGIQMIRITLDVGLATFQPIRVRTVEGHRMLGENYFIGRGSAHVINEAKKESRPVAAVGTTTVRTLESAFSQGRIRSGSRLTDLFIYPGFEFQAVDRLLTNFHLPKSTLLMMIAAFAGIELVKDAYREAVKKGYRFYSYGDCMLIL